MPVVEANSFLPLIRGHTRWQGESHPRLESCLGASRMGKRSWVSWGILWIRPEDRTCKVDDWFWMAQSLPVHHHFCHRSLWFLSFLEDLRCISGDTTWLAFLDIKEPKLHFLVWDSTVECWRASHSCLESIGQHHLDQFHRWSSSLLHEYLAHQLPKYHLH